MKIEYGPQIDFFFREVGRETFFRRPAKKRIFIRFTKLEKIEEKIEKINPLDQIYFL